MQDHVFIYAPMSLLSVGMPHVELVGMVFEVRGGDEAVVRLMGTAFEMDPPSS